MIFVFKHAFVSKRTVVMAAWVALATVSSLDDCCHGNEEEDGMQEVEGGGFGVVGEERGGCKEGII